MPLKISFFLVLCLCRAYGDQAFDQTTSVAYTQEPLQLDGWRGQAVIAPKGTIIKSRVEGRAPTPCLIISDSVSTFDNGGKPVRFSGRENDLLLAGELVKLPSGEFIQYCRGLGDEPCQLIHYTSKRGLSIITNLKPRPPLEPAAAGSTGKAPSIPKP
ncbi:MAG TPA: hypothetical protein VNB29_06840 [Chthoniobacterales bacterium]|nr:hypothetical protein [Chthoniobacterales bacterium]